MAETDAERARAEAEAILAGDRYTARELPRPFEGPLRWIGERLQDLGEPFADLLSTPQGVAVSAVAIGVVAAALVSRAVRRRTRLAALEEHSARRRGRVDPRQLEREADAAEHDGDLDAAVRLRFRAGVLQLADAGVATARPGATTGRLVATVPAPDLAPLAVAFDAIAYGGRRATAADVAAARRGWPRVLAEVRAAADEDPRP